MSDTLGMLLGLGFFGLGGLYLMYGIIKRPPAMVARLEKVGKDIGSPLYKLAAAGSLFFAAVCVWALINTANKPTVTVGSVTATINGEPATVTQTTVTANGAVEVKETEPATPLLAKEQAKQAAQKLYKDIKTAQAEGVKVMEFLSQYPEQGGEIRNVSVKFNQAIDNSKIDNQNNDYSSCYMFATYARLSWQEKYSLRSAEQSNTVTMSKLDMMKRTTKQLAEFEKDCKVEIK